jgi:hypothetical protein
MQFWRSKMRDKYTQKVTFDPLKRLDWNLRIRWRSMRTNGSLSFSANARLGQKSYNPSSKMQFWRSKMRDKYTQKVTFDPLKRLGWDLRIRWRSMRTKGSLSFSANARLGQKLQSIVKNAVLEVESRSFPWILRHGYIRLSVVRQCSSWSVDRLTDDSLPLDWRLVRMDFVSVLRPLK